VGGLVAGAGGRQPEASAMQQMIDGHCSDTRLHERRIVMREASKVVVIEWGKRNLNRLAFNASLGGATPKFWIVPKLFFTFVH